MAIKSFFKKIRQDYCKFILVVILVVILNIYFD